ncbi:MAG: hypothetical protein CVT99_02190 [Bacteroidetes bacterium HGW-Bacteroidetes-16]|jgi:hypothetical protein|nr:MAG: hypothetical protein CVT99_02190 [Bacteroidetes bacterium HGW-Bacteroidetes-16]
MEKYTSEKLAALVQQSIYLNFDTPEKIKTKFGSNIKRKVKSFQREILTNEEIEGKVEKFASSIHANLCRITIGDIINVLSSNLKNKSNYQGIDLAEYDEYFNELAIELVKELINAKYNSIKKDIRNFNK